MDEIDDQDILQMTVVENFHGPDENGDLQYNSNSYVTRHNDPQAYKGGKIMYFSIFDLHKRQQVASYVNCRLSYDPNDKNIKEIIEEIEDYNTEFFEESEWVQSPRHMYSGNRPEDRLERAEMPKHFVTVDHANSPDFTFDPDTQKQNGRAPEQGSRNLP